MRVLFDLRTLAARWHGIARHGVGLLGALVKLHPKIEWTALVRTSARTADLPPGIARALPIDIAPYSAREQLLLPIAIWRLRPDLFVTPTYVAPLLCPVPFVLTVHDLIDFKAARPALRHRVYFPHILPRIAHRAAAVMTDSEYSRRDLVGLGLPAAKLHVVPSGHSLTPRLDLPRAERLLHLTNGRPHKNTALVLALFRRLAPRFPKLSLTIIGATPLGASHSQRIDMRPSVTPDVLAMLYSSSAVTLVPSFAEGFGLPALESMACGTPVVASNRAALPEVVGDAAPLLSPDDLDAWERVVSRIITHSAYARDLSDRGLKRAATMTWEATARAWSTAVTRALGADFLD